MSSPFDDRSRQSPISTTRSRSEPQSKLQAFDSCMPNPCQAKQVGMLVSGDQVPTILKISSDQTNVLQTEAMLGWCVCASILRQSSGSHFGRREEGTACRCADRNYCAKKSLALRASISPAQASLSKVYPSAFLCSQIPLPTHGKCLRQAFSG